MLVKCDKKFFVESHRKSKQQQRKLETKSKSQSKQIFLQLHQVNFKEELVSLFLAADIPLYKPNHPSLKYLFATMGKVLPSETAAWACVAKLASQKEEQIQELLRDKNIFLIVDETEITKQKYTSVLVGSLAAPNQTFLLLLLVTRPLPRDGGMAEHHGAPEAGQLSRVWTRGRKETESRQRVSGAKSP